MCTQKQTQQWHLRYHCPCQFEQGAHEALWNWWQMKQPNAMALPTGLYCALGLSQGGMDMERDPTTQHQHKDSGAKAIIRRPPLRGPPGCGGSMCNPVSSVPCVRCTLFSISRFPGVPRSSQDRLRVPQDGKKEAQSMPNDTHGH